MLQRLAIGDVDFDVTGWLSGVKKIMERTPSFHFIH